MEDVRNKDGKKVCAIDKVNRVVEILYKGAITTIRFSGEGRVQIENN
jgi:hypothetical protein